MTKDGEVEHFEDVSYNDSQQPVQVVLIDVKRAACNKEIYCVKKPLDECEDLNYVAISYRWGELDETIIDTKVGYLATITSFDLEDFYQLCATLTKERNLKSMDYVWIDAICVNQADYEQRKATIHHMTSIYEQAAYILAVPDLYAAHLSKTMKSNKEIMSHIRREREYIYYLLHRNVDQLYAYDERFLDTIGVPRDPSLRQLLTKYTDFFTDGLIKLREHHSHFDPLKALDHLCDVSHESFPTSPPCFSSDGDDKCSAKQEDTSSVTDIKTRFGKDAAKVETKIQSLHHCHEMDCPLKLMHFATNNVYRQQCCHHHEKENKWQQDIYKRSTIIRQSMHFLTDLIIDWSSRVWVISEYNISKKKKNMKYWFTQLASPQDDNSSPNNTITFFKFNHPKRGLHLMEITRHTPRLERSVVLDPVYLTFYKTLLNQLNRQTFLEMMLKSKASKNEDRFYSIFPLFPKYKDILKSKDLVKSWNITSILSVKLKLYEVMSNNDKVDLLYLSGKGKAAHISPTFATSTVSWQQYKILDLSKEYMADFKITFHKTNSNGMSYLHLIPSKYDKPGRFRKDTSLTMTLLLQDKKNETLYKQLFLDDLMDTIDLVRIPTFSVIEPFLEVDDYFVKRVHYIYLIGSFKRNTWILGNEANDVTSYDFQWPKASYDFAGFNIY